MRVGVVGTAYVLGLAVVLCTWGCKDRDLERVAQTLKITAQTVGEVQTLVIEANRAGNLSVPDTRRFLELCEKINLAGQQATAVTRGLAKLAPEDRGRLGQIFEPVLVAVRDGLDTGLIGIGEPLRTRLRLILETLRSTLVTVQAVLGG